MQETLVQFLVWKIRWRRDRLPTPVFLVFPCGSAGKESACNVGDLGSIPGSERLLIPVFWPGIPWTIVHGVTEWTWLNDFHVLPDPGTDPVSSALAGRFFTTEQPGKPYPHLNYCADCMRLAFFTENTLRKQRICATVQVFHHRKFYSYPIRHAKSWAMYSSRKISFT